MAMPLSHHSEEKKIMTNVSKVISMKKRGKECFRLSEYFLRTHCQLLPFSLLSVLSCSLAVFLHVLKNVMEGAEQDTKVDK